MTTGINQIAFLCTLVTFVWARDEECLDKCDHARCLADCHLRDPSRAGCVGECTGFKFMCIFGCPNEEESVLIQDANALKVASDDSPDSPSQLDLPSSMVSAKRGKEQAEICSFLRFLQGGTHSSLDLDATGAVFPGPDRRDNSRGNLADLHQYLDSSYTMNVGRRVTDVQARWQIIMEAAAGKEQQAVSSRHEQILFLRSSVIGGQRAVKARAKHLLDSTEKESRVCRMDVSFQGDGSDTIPYVSSLEVENAVREFNGLLEHRVQARVLKLQHGYHRMHQEHLAALQKVRSTSHTETDVSLAQREIRDLRLASSDSETASSLLVLVGVLACACVVIAIAIHQSPMASRERQGIDSSYLLG